MAKLLTPEHWAKIRENNKSLRDTIDKIEISGITAEEYTEKYPKLARLINLEEVVKMKLKKQTIVIPDKISKKIAKASQPKVDIIIAGNITPKDLAKQLNTSAKVLRKVIRKLKLNRTGKCWQWNPAKDAEEITLIKEAYKKSLEPAVEKKPKPKAAKAVQVEETETEKLREEEEAESGEDEDEEEEEEKDISDTIRVDPQM